MTRRGPACEELPVGVRLQAGRLELRVGGRKRRPLVEQLALHLHLPVAVARLGRFEIEPRLQRGLLQLGVAQLEDHRVGDDEGAGADDDPLDGAVGGGGNPADLLRDQRPGAAHLPHHRAALHRVQIDRVAVDARRGRLQARDAQRDDSHHQDRGYGIPSLAQLLLPCEIGSGDIHGKYPVFVPRASDSYRLSIEFHKIYRMSIGESESTLNAVSGSTRAARRAGTQLASRRADQNTDAGTKTVRSSTPVSNRIDAEAGWSVPAPTRYRASRRPASDHPPPRVRAGARRAPARRRPRGWPSRGTSAPGQLRRRGRPARPRARGDGRAVRLVDGATVGLLFDGALRRNMVAVLRWAEHRRPDRLRDRGRLNTATTLGAQGNFASRPPGPLSQCRSRPRGRSRPLGAIEQGSLSVADRPAVKSVRSAVTGWTRLARRAGR